MTEAILGGTVLANSPIPSWLIHFENWAKHLFIMVRHALNPTLTTRLMVGTSAALNSDSLGVIWWGICKRNLNRPSLMKLVWAVVVCSGPIGLAVYRYSGQTPIDYGQRGNRSEYVTVRG